MKKIISLLLAMLMVFSLATVAFAEEATSVAVDYDVTNDQHLSNGSIHISGVSTENVYSVYKMLHLESYVKDTGVYAYKVVNDWVEFFGRAEVQVYMTIDTGGYASWIGEDSDARKIAFSKLALAYAKEKNIQPLRISSKTGDMVINAAGDGVFSGLTMGYYLVDSTMGALCGLTTTNPDAYITAKNAAPTIDKQVMEDSTSQWGGSNTADIGQVVNFRVTINVHGGAENYVLHDKTNGKFIMYGTDIPEEVKPLVGVKELWHVIPATQAGAVAQETEVPADYYTVVENPTDGCAFHIVFEQEFCDHLKTNDKVVVYYDAMLSRNASIHDAVNPNEAWLDFGENHHTAHDVTNTSTYAVEIVKTDDQNKLIPGAKFRIYDSNGADANEVDVVALERDAQGNVTVYRRARADEEGVEIVVTTGIVKVVGFDNGTYYLEETDPPHGYTKLSGRKEFIISDANLYAQYVDGNYYSGSGIHVINKTGSMLPETGAMGTAMFITFGMFVMLGTGVLLVTKKRMSMIED